MAKRLPTVIVVDAGRTLEAKWWSLPQLPVTVTLFTGNVMETLDLARVYGVDLLVVRPPIDGIATDDLITLVRRAHPDVRTAVIVGWNPPPSLQELRGASPDFVAAESLDPVLLSAALGKLLGVEQAAGPMFGAASDRAAGGTR